MRSDSISILWSATRGLIAITCLVAAIASADAGQRAEPGERLAPSRADIERAARRIDLHWQRDLRVHGVDANPEVDDATFLRRAYLTLGGRIPTAAEVEAFEADDALDRRRQLVDDLLDSDAYESRMFAFFADLLRVREKLAGVAYISGEPYIHYIKESLAGDKPFDQLVRELLTASGPAHARGNGATGYYLRDRGMPEDNMANTVRVFLGTRLECAQCHDHPFDRWTQREFYGMAAFTGGLSYRDDSLRGTAVGDRFARLNNELKRDGDKAAVRGLKRSMRGFTAGVSGAGAGVIQLPKDYAYDDASPLDWVTATPIFGQAEGLDGLTPPKAKKKGKGKRGKQSGKVPRGVLERLADEVESREVYAEWLTSPDNPRFTRVIANRMWKLMMGRGLVEPVDDWTDQTVPVNPALMDALAELMVELDYDLKQFLRVIAYSDAWQRAATLHDVAADEEYRFPGPLTQRLSAEQLWDSLLTLALDDVDGTLMPAGARAEPVYVRYDEFLQQDDDELRATVDREALRYSDPTAYKSAVRAAKAERAQDGKKIRKLFKQLSKAERRGQKQKASRLRAQLVELGADPDHPGSRKRTATALLRASEISQPAPDDHLLRQFGQSDREQIDASHREATVPQVLSLLNGFLEERVLNDPRSAVWRAIESSSDPRERVRAAYRCVLVRAPDAGEENLWLADVETYGQDAYRDLVWILANSHEFRLVR